MSSEDFKKRLSEINKNLGDTVNQLDEGIEEIKSIRREISENSSSNEKNH